MRTVRVDICRSTVCLPSSCGDLAFAVHKAKTTSYAAWCERRIRRSYDAQLHSSTLPPTHVDDCDSLLSQRWILANDVSSERTQKHMQNAAAKQRMPLWLMLLELMAQATRERYPETEKKIQKVELMRDLSRQSYAHCHARPSITHGRTLIISVIVKVELILLLLQLLVFCVLLRFNCK